MRVLIIIGLLATMAMGAFELTYPTVNATVIKGTDVQFTWTSGVYDTPAKYACPNTPGDAGTQYARLTQYCDQTEAARLSAYSLYQQIYPWVVDAVRVMEGPAVNASEYYNRYLFPQAANLSTIGIDISKFPNYGLATVIPSLADFTYYYPLGRVLYPYADLKTDLFGRRGGGCNTWMARNASDILAVYLQYLDAIQSGNSYLLDSFNENLYPAFAPYYQNLSAYYTDVLQPKANEMLTQFGIDLSKFPAHALPTINLNTQPEYVYYSIGSCTLNNAIDNDNNPVTLNIWAGLDYATNITAIMTVAKNVDNAGTFTYRIPCDFTADMSVEPEYVFFRVFSATQQDFVQFQVQPCSAAALSISMIVVVLMAMLSTVL